MRLRDIILRHKRRRFFRLCMRRKVALLHRLRRHIRRKLVHEPRGPAIQLLRNKLLEACKCAAHLEEIPDDTILDYFGNLYYDLQVADVKAMERVKSADAEVVARVATDIKMAENMLAHFSKFRNVVAVLVTLGGAGMLLESWEECIGHMHGDAFRSFPLTEWKQVMHAPVELSKSSMYHERIMDLTARICAAPAS